MTNLSSIVEQLAKQALGSNASGDSSNSGNSGNLGGLLGSVISQLGQSNSTNQSGGLGGLMGSVLNQFGQQSDQNENNSNSTNNSSNNANAGSAINSSLLLMVVPLILGWVQKQGGLSGVISSLQSAGLGEQLQQWLDPNQSNTEAPVEQVQNLFQADEVQQVADQAQVPTQQVYSAISSVLPQIVDALTPQGAQTNQAEANQDVGSVMSMLSSFLKK